MIGRSHLIVGGASYATLWCHPLGPLAVPLLPRTHDLPGLLAGHPSATWLGSLAALVVALLAVALGSLMPDLDDPDTRLANQRILGLPVLRPFASVMGKIFGHRQATHSLLALVAVILIGEFPFLAQTVASAGTWVAGLALPNAAQTPDAPPLALLRDGWPLLLLGLTRLSQLHLGLIVGWGFASHLLADMLTKRGVPLLWPLGWDFGLPPLRALRITTGTAQEATYVTALVLLGLVNALLANQDFAAAARHLLT